MAALSARDLFYLYRSLSGDVAALRGLSLELAEGEIVAALGPSGAGKSTLLALAAGFVRPSSGELTILGERFDRASLRQAASIRRRRIGIVRQHYNRALPQELTVEEIVALPGRLLGRPRGGVSTQVAALLERAGLSDRAKARPYELSGGEQQRVAVCAALAKRPTLILADEPTGELDAETRDSVMDLLLELARASGAAALIVTHDTHVAERTDRTIHVRDGRLAAEGTETPVLIVDKQGWIRLPDGLRERANLGERVRAAATVGRIQLTAETSASQPAAAETAIVPAPRADKQDGPGAPVTLNNVVKRFGDLQQKPVVDLSWSAEPAKLHVLAGPSGSGKTTILNLIAALDRPSSGEILVGEERVDAFNPDAAAEFRKRTVGLLSQHSTLVDYLTAAENVELALTFRGIDPAEAATRAREWLSWVGLEKLADRRADHLSGGEQRRVALARALAPMPQLLLADEPTAHLDQLTGRTVIQLLQAAAHQTGATTIATSHDPDVLAAADTVLNLDSDQPRTPPPPRPEAAPHVRPTDPLFETADPEKPLRPRTALRVLIAAAFLTVIAAIAAVALAHHGPHNQASDSLLDGLRAALHAPGPDQILVQHLTISATGSTGQLRLTSWTTGGTSPRHYRANIAGAANGGPSRQIDIDATLGPKYVETITAGSNGKSFATITPTTPMLGSASFDVAGLVRAALNTDYASLKPVLVDDGRVIRVQFAVHDSRGTLGRFVYLANAHTYKPLEVEFPHLLTLSTYLGEDLGLGGAALSAPLFSTPGLANDTNTFTYRYQSFAYEPATARTKAPGAQAEPRGATPTHPAGSGTPASPACVRPFGILYKGRCIKTPAGSAGT